MVNYLSSAYLHTCIQLRLFGERVSRCARRQRVLRAKVPSGLDARAPAHFTHAGHALVHLRAILGQSVRHVRLPRVAVVEAAPGRRVARREAGGRLWSHGTRYVRHARG